MKLAARLQRPLILIAAAAFLGAAVPAHAQDIAESHMKAARAAIAALHATDPFDAIILDLATQLKMQLYQRNPDLQEQISEIVDETAIELAGRRLDLEREAATSYAKTFTEEQLNEIAEFYNSDAGKKLLEEGPAVILELRKQAEVWGGGIQRDLGTQVSEKLAEYMKANPSAAPKAE